MEESRRELVELLKKLVSVRSVVRIEDGKVVREGYREAADLIAEEASRAGLRVDTLELGSEDGRVPVVMAWPEVEAEGDLALVSHYDVVPARESWTVEGREVDPFEPVLVGDKLYGRGAADDKSAVAASIVALKEAVEEGRGFKHKPVIVVTGDEEVGLLGVRALLDAGYKWDRAVILDASADYVSIGASGVIHGWVKIYGRRGHAGYPHLAENPVTKLAKVMEYMIREYGAVRSRRISRFPSPPGSPVPRVWGRFNFTIVKLGEGEAEKHNIIPGEAVAGFDARLLPEEDVEEALRELLEYFSAALDYAGARGSVEIVTSGRGWYSTDEGLVEEAVGALERALAKTGVEQPIRTAAELGGNDGTFFFLRGIPVVAFGAMRDDNNVHGDGEFVYVRDLVLLKEFIKELVSR